ncbi:hypothetical protein PHET_11722 [Paragonimus heterotremus]|uniref:Uncharacterized protein n=1 Tax=Paragonimus heterotremus TaxID=100268 RepID=A0A8J4SRJ9_9TREM|nr:hypothetical protein PHET_11722 [Paragonimus heterotremus]
MTSLTNPSYPPRLFSLSFGHGPLDVRISVTKTKSLISESRFPLCHLLHFYDVGS